MVTILIVALWIMYGSFSLVQDKTTWKDSTSGETNPIGQFLFHMALAPLILVIKALYGIFKEYHEEKTD